MGLPWAGVGVSLLVIAGAACSSDPPDPAQAAPSTSTAVRPSVRDAPDCRAVAVRTVDAVQVHVDRFTSVEPEDVAAAVEEGRDELGEAATSAQERAQELGCEAPLLRALLAVELERLTGSGSVAEDVAATFRSALLGTDDPSDPAPVELTVVDGPTLATALATAGSGSTITLGPGTYDLDQPLVLFRPVTIAGGPEGPARIVSSAPDAAMLSLAGGEVVLRDLTIEHTGASPASIVLIRAGSARLERVTLRGGRAEEGLGGIGLLLRSADGTEPSVVADSEFVDNDGGGIVVGGTDSPTLRGIATAGNRTCGVCYLEHGGGTLEQAELVDEPVGISVDDDASPALQDLVFTRVTAAAVVVSGRSRAELAALTCDGSAGGIVLILEAAEPVLGDGITCETATGSG